MRLIKTRPQVKLALPTQVYPGDDVRADVLLDARREVDVRRISATLDGYETVAAGAGDSRRSQKKHLVGLRAELTGETLLPKGRTRMACVFRLPADVPPSYEGHAGTLMAKVAYEITVHVDIPWWPDRRVTFVMVVGRRPARRVQPDKKIFSPDPQGPRRQEAYVEVALDDTLVLPGGTLRGQLAAYNTKYNRYGKTELALVGQQRVMLNGRVMEGEALRYTIGLDLGAVAEAEALPFAMKLPDRIPASYEANLWSLHWRFEVKARYDFVRNLTFQVPVEILPPGSEAKHRTRQAPLVIGSARLRAIWAAVAEEMGLSHDPERGVLSGQEGETSLTLRRDHRGAEGIFLAATLRYPSLHLGLDGGSASSFRRVVGGGVSLGDARWDRDHYLTSREHEQLASLVTPLAPHLLALRLYDIDDETMVIHHRDAGQSPKQLRWFAQSARALAQSLAQARTGVTPPATMADSVPAWNALAKRLRAPLQTTRMAVNGAIETTPVEIATEWGQDDKPLFTRVEARFRDPVADKHRLNWGAQDGLRRGDLAELNESARARWTSLCEGALAVDVEREHLTVALPAPADDPLALYGRAEAILAFYGALVAGQGPYR